MGNSYDVVIIGGGPAGLSAAVYAARAKMSTLVVEKSAVGGLITLTGDVENYPGGLPGESGIELTDRMKKQAEKFGAVFASDEITGMNISGKEKILTGYNGTYRAKAVIIAAGAYPRKLECSGETEHVGQGVSYCATCDGSFFSGLEVFVAGGGDAALEEAVFLTKFAKKVTVIHRRDEFRASPYVVEKAKKNDKIKFMLSTQIVEIKGEGAVESLVLKDLKTGNLSEYKADPGDGMMGVFVFIGYKPNTELVKGVIELDSNGYIITNDKMETNIEGIYAAGDIRAKTLRQVVTAVSDGAIAAVEAEKYIADVLK